MAEVERPEKEGGGGRWRWRRRRRRFGGVGCVEKAWRGVAGEARHVSCFCGLRISGKGGVAEEEKEETSFDKEVCEVESERG